MAIRPGRASQAGDSLTPQTGAPHAFWGATNTTPSLGTSEVDNPLAHQPFTPNSSNHFFNSLI